MRIKHSLKRELYQEKAMDLYFKEGICGTHIADFRKARHLADAGGGDPFPLEELLRAARGDHLPAPILQWMNDRPTFQT